MGIHIILYKDGKKLPEWDSLRQWNDREFPQLVFVNGTKNVSDDDEGNFIPKNIPELRNLIDATDWEQDSKKRYHLLCDLVEKGAEVYFSC